MPHRASFSQLPLTPALLHNLDSLGYHTMTAIQAETLPHILAGKDVIAQAKTGSGKTAAFGLGILHKIIQPYFATQGLVLCPTRELADQVAQEIRRLARSVDNIKVLTLTGGTPMGPQIGSLEHGAHIVVGTPGRIRDHLYRGSLDLSTVSTLVLDEADRMIDMGFYEDIAAIVSVCGTKKGTQRQTLLFSATYPDNIRQASAAFLKQPVEVKVETQHAAGHIEQRFYQVEKAQRNAALVQLLLHFRPVSTLAFCNTKAECRTVADALCAAGIAALPLYGDLEQRDRDLILTLFASQATSVLVATDVAARGLDIQHLGAVINVEISKDPEVHVHRIGRTGRAAQKGLALNLCTPHESKWLKLIEAYQGITAQWYDLAAATPSNRRPLEAPMAMLSILGGKKEKLRAGDILGALTGPVGLSKEQVGKITVFEFVTYVALDHRIAESAYAILSRTPIKGRQFRMRFV